MTTGSGNDRERERRFGLGISESRTFADISGHSCVAKEPKGAWRCRVEPEFLFPERFSVINYHVASVALLDLCTSHGMLSRTSAKSRELIQQFTPRLHESRRHSRESGTQESFADGNVLYLSGYGFPPPRE